MTRKVALITGVTGQDGAYLAKLLLGEGYEVFGAIRHSTRNTWRLDALGIRDEVHQLQMDLADFRNILRTLEIVKPDEIYNLAAQSFVSTSFEHPIYTADYTGTSVCRLIEAVRQVVPESRFYQASTSEMFGKVQVIPQDESTPFYPRSPYGVAKLAAHWMVINYRESYGMHLSNGILFNHESPLRGLEFVTRKITSQLAEIRFGHRKVLELGNLDARRDWGFAGDYVRGMWAMVQHSIPLDYVLATGRTVTVREFVVLAAEAVGIQLEWSGADTQEVGINRQTGQAVVRVNEAFFRPAEVNVLVGRADKARSTLGWKPEVAIQDIVQMMVEADMRRAEKGPILH